MFKSIISYLRGAFLFLLYAINTIFWCIPLFAVAILKFLVPFKLFRKNCDRLLNGFANSWVRVNNYNQGVFGKTRWHVHGIESLKAEDWYLIVSNHQSWVDILVLQKIFHKKIPFLKFFLKKELIWFPILGQAWWALDMPFMRRYSKSFIKKNPHLAGRDLEITRKACEKFRTIPVSIINFTEGTRFSKAKQKMQRSPYQTLLRPKAGGVAFTLGAMGKHLNSFLDVTIAYPGGTMRFWDFLCGNIKDIHVQVRSLPITSEMLGDYFNDRVFRKKFQAWLNTLWEQKDRCIEAMLSNSRPNPNSDDPVPSCFLEPMPVLEHAIVPNEAFPAAPKSFS